MWQGLSMCARVGGGDVSNVHAGEWSWHQLSMAAAATWSSSDSAASRSFWPHRLAQQAGLLHTSSSSRGSSSRGSGGGGNGDVSEIADCRQLLAQGTTDMRLGAAMCCGMCCVRGSSLKANRNGALKTGMMIAVPPCPVAPEIMLFPARSTSTTRLRQSQRQSGTGTWLAPLHTDGRPSPVVATASSFRAKLLDDVWWCSSDPPCLACARGSSIIGSTTRLIQPSRSKSMHRNFILPTRLFEKKEHLVVAEPRMLCARFCRQTRHQLYTMQ